MNSMRTIFRCMLLLWLVAVAALGVAVSRSTSTTYIGNTMAFLFSHAGEDHAALIQPERRPAPRSEDGPAVAAPQEWVKLSRGKTAGGGTLGAPAIEELEGGAVAVVMPLTGTVGDVSFYTPTNVSGVAVDIIGEWSKPPYLKRHMSSGCLSLVQAAGHKGYLRVSGVAAKGVAKIEAKAEHSASRGAVRVVFSPAGGGKGK